MKRRRSGRGRRGSRRGFIFVPDSGMVKDGLVGLGGFVGPSMLVDWISTPNAFTGGKALVPQLAAPGLPRIAAEAASSILVSSALAKWSGSRNATAFAMGSLINMLSLGFSMLRNKFAASGATSGYSYAGYGGTQGYADPSTMSGFVEVVR